MTAADLQRALMGGRADKITAALTTLITAVDSGNDKQSKTTAQVAASANTTVTFTSPALAVDSPVVNYRLRVIARQTSPSTNPRLVASFPVIVYRNSGNAAVELGALVAEFGTGIALTGGAVANVSAAVNAGGTTITVTIANASANGYTFTAELIAL